MEVMIHKFTTSALGTRYMVCFKLSRKTENTPTGNSVLVIQSAH